MSWVSRPHLLVDTHLKTKQLLSCYLLIHVTSKLWQIFPSSISAICSPCSADPWRRPHLASLRHCWAQLHRALSLLWRSQWLIGPLTLLPISLWEAWFSAQCETKQRSPTPIRSLGHTLLPILLGSTALQSFYWKNTFHFCSQPSLSLALRFAITTLGRGESKVNARMHPAVELPAMVPGCAWLLSPSRWILS